jgi:hypothetical protein
MKFDLPETTHDHVIDQLIGKSWGDLEVIEQAGRLLFPDKIYKRVNGGKFEEVPILIQVPRHADLCKARVEARRHAAEDGLDPKLDRDLIEDWETICTLSICLRNPKPPDHEQWEPFPRALAEMYDRQSIMQIWAKLNALTQVIDPAPDSLSTEEMYALIAAVAKERNLSPFFVYGQAAQTSCVVFMADQLLSLLELKSSSEPSEPLTQEFSPSGDSPKS